jgi:hypothetical protein
MPKVVLPPIGSMTNQTAFLAALNARLVTIGSAFDNTVSRDGALPNSMDADFDMDTNFVMNVKDPIALGDAVNLRTLIQAVLGEGGGPGVGVEPEKFVFIGDGTTTDYLMEGATVDDPEFYDASLEGEVLEPGVDYTIVVVPGAAREDDEYYFRFTVAPPNLDRGFAVLRGFASVANPGDPLTTVKPTIVTITQTTIIDGAYQNYLFLSTSATPIEIRVAANLGSENPWESGESFSVAQLGAGQVTIVMDTTGSVLPSPGFEEKTRGVGSIISGTCAYPDGDEWLASGDLNRLADSPVYETIRIEDRSVLSGTDVAAGLGLSYYVVPYGMILRSIADGGLFATLRVAQPSGSLLTVDIHRNGTSILNTKLIFDNTETTTRTAATQPVYATGGETLATGDILTLDVDVVGDAGAKEVAVTLVGQRT